MMLPHVSLGSYRAQYIESKGRIWASRGYTVYYSDDCGQSFHPYSTCPAPFHYRVTANWRLVNRVLRGGILGLLPLADGGLLAVMYGRLLRCEPDSRLFQPVLTRPGCTVKLEQTPDGRVYAGEYFYNAQRQPVLIFVSEDHGRTWQTAYTFPAQVIRHVHALIYDRIRQRLMVLTGDLDHESKILYTTDSFRSISTLAEGSQRARAVGIIPVQNGYLLPTDSPYEQNYVQFLKEDGSLRRLCPVAGSCLAASKVGDWAIFGTAVEPSPVNLDPCAVLYGTPDGTEWHVIDRWRVDFWSGSTARGAALFQMARILLPPGDNQTGHLFATTIATHDFDGMLHRWQLTDR